MKKSAKKRRKPPVSLARIPLPKKTEKRHGDAKKYSRPTEKERLRRHPDA